MGIAMIAWTACRHGRVDGVSALLVGLRTQGWPELVAGSASSRSEVVSAWQRTFGLLLMEAEKSQDCAQAVSLLTGLAAEIEHRVLRSLLLNAALMASLSAGDTTGMRVLLRKMFASDSQNAV